MTAGPDAPVVQLVDYRAGNLFSIRRALEFVGAQVSVVRSPEDWDPRATHVVLPGVGAYAAGMDVLTGLGLDFGLRERAAAGVPLLGICLGAQLLFASSEEFGSHVGLGLLDGAVRRLPEGSGRVPHIGWAVCEPHSDGEHTVLSTASDTWMYFVHSYMFEPTGATRRLLTATAGGAVFAAAAGAGNVLGVQFHPERSGDAGLQLLRRFCAWGGENA
jgi:imidazole glycerol phosphate synthase glutamine amidotransferase subunit